MDGQYERVNKDSPPIKITLTMILEANVFLISVSVVSETILIATGELVICQV